MYFNRYIPVRRKLFCDKALRSGSMQCFSDARSDGGGLFWKEWGGFLRVAGWNGCGDGGSGSAEIAGDREYVVFFGGILGNA